MKAHEEDWFYDKNSGEIRYADKPDVPLDFFADEEAGKLAAAAPKMARALIALDKCGLLDGYSEMQQIVVEALITALGPPPPHSS